MQHDILNTEVTTIDGEKTTTGILCRQGAADRQCSLEMRPDAAV